MSLRHLYKTLTILLGVGLALSISLADVAWVLAGSLVLIIKIAKPSASPWKKTGFEPVMLTFALWALFTSNWTLPLAGIFRNFKSEILLLIFFVVTQAFREEDNNILLRSFLIASLVGAALGCLQKIGGLSWDPTTGHREIPSGLSFLSSWPHKPFRYISLRDGRAMGTRSHPLTYAECLLPAFFIFLAASLREEETRSYWKHLIFAVITGLAITASQSRGVWLGLVGGLIVLLWQHRNSQARLTIGSLIFLGALLVWALPESRGRLTSIFKHTQGPNESSKNVRWELWKESLQFIKSHPLKGVGTGNLRILLPYGEEHEPKPTLWSEAHNIYLQETAEQGLPGLLIFCWLLFKLGWIFRSVDHQQQNGFLATFVGLLICGLTESWFNDAEPTMVLLALGASAWISKGEVNPS